MMVTIFLTILIIAAIFGSVKLIFKLIEIDDAVIAASNETKQNIHKLHAAFSDLRCSLKNIKNSTKETQKKFDINISDILIQGAGLLLLLKLGRKKKF